MAKHRLSCIEETDNDSEANNNENSVTEADAEHHHLHYLQEQQQLELAEVQDQNENENERNAGHQRNNFDDDAVDAGRDATTSASANVYTHPNVGYGVENDADNADDDDGDDDKYDEDDVDSTEQSWHEMLDNELQPEPPLDNSIESKDIYYEHKRLAKEYLRIDTNIYYAKDFKEKFLEQMAPDERQQKEELLRKFNEKVELLELYNNLTQQLESLQREQNSKMEPTTATTTQLNDKLLEDGNWVVISSNQNFT